MLDCSDVNERFLSVKYVGLAFAITMDVWPLPFKHDFKMKEPIVLRRTRKAFKNVDTRFKDGGYAIGLNVN